MANVLELVVRAKDEASNVLESVGEKGASAGNMIADNWMKVTAAGAAAGAAIEGMGRSQQTLTKGVKELAARTGESEQSIRDLAKSTSNVTFPMEEVVELMVMGRRAGLEGSEQLQEYATFWDMVGDATGENSRQLAKSGAALRAVGVEAGQEKEVLGALGFVMDNTSANVGEFLQFIERMAPEMREMGLSVDDAAAVMGALEQELGLTSRTARMEFRQAVNEADGDMNKVIETLGLSQEQFQQYRAEVDNSSGAIERNAQIHAESFTPMQKLQHAASELMFKYGDLIQASTALVPVMIAIGPATKGLQLAFGGLTTAMAVAKAGAAKLFAFLMANPYVAIIAATIALVILIVKNWDTIKEVVSTALEFLQNLFTSVFDAILGFLESWWPVLLGVMTMGIGTVVMLIVQNWDAILEKTREIFDAVVRTIKGFLEWLGGVPSAIWSILKNAWNFFADATRAVSSFIVDRFNDVIGFLGGIPGRIFGALRNAWNFYFDLIAKVRSVVVDAFEFILGYLSGMPRRIAAAATGMWEGVTGAFKTAINWIIEKWNNFKISVGGWKIPGPGPIPDVTLPKVTVNMPSIPKLQRGGRSLAGGLALVGEAGPELLDLPTGATVAPLGRGDGLNPILEVLRSIERELINVRTELGRARAQISVNSNAVDPMAIANAAVVAMRARG